VGVWWICSFLVVYVISPFNDCTYKYVGSNMEEQSSAFPLPPNYYRNFTEENVEKVRETSKDALPAELQQLVPPPLPKDGTYQCFGQTWNIKNELPSLQASGIQDLFPRDGEGVGSKEGTHERTDELRRCARSLLLNYLELVGILGIAPEKFPDKVEQIRVILINMHHLLNEYRPHQARETLISIYQMRLEKSRAENRARQEACEDVSGILEEVDGLLKSSQGPQDMESMTMENGLQTRDLRTWAAIKLAHSHTLPNAT